MSIEVARLRIGVLRAVGQARREEAMCEAAAGSRCDDARALTRSSPKREAREGEGDHEVVEGGAAGREPGG